MSSHVAIWLIAAASVGAVIVRPFDIIEAVWPVSGATLLVVFGLLAPAVALRGVVKGVDVYLFLTGMMLLAEVARSEGLFDWLAAIAARRADGSGEKLFLLTYCVGTVVTVFLSNDATAVVLTPAVAAAARAAKVEQPLPYLLICAFIANAASFVLPISNPANLVVYGAHMPSLWQWLSRYLPPSAISIVLTYVLLRRTQRAALRQTIATEVALPKLSAGGKAAAAGISATAVLLLTASGLDTPLGLPTFIAGLSTAALVLIGRPIKAWRLIRDISWGVLPLVAGLFVLVEALNETGVIATLSEFLREAASESVAWAACGAGIAVAAASNLANNLPVGLIAGSAIQSGHIADPVTRAVLIGVDLGPNLSVTGSLATILWLGALRREGQQVKPLAFLALGIVIMPATLFGAMALVLALGIIAPSLM
ncbi:MAG: arsenic transporter [Xanthobacteraceae bacterium]